MVFELTVRVATPADAPALAVFAARTFREAFSHMVPPDAMGQYLRDSFDETRVTAEIADPDTVFLLAEDDAGVSAGYAKIYFGGRPPAPNSGGAGGEGTVISRPIGERISAVFPSAPPESGAGGLSLSPVKLWRLYTAREWQGRGVGAALLKAASVSARERGGDSLWLTVNTNNTGAVRFYERNGFRQTGYTTFNLGGEIQRDFVMERLLG